MLAIAALVTARAAISMTTVSTELSRVVFAWSLKVRILRARVAKHVPRQVTQCTNYAAESFSFLPRISRIDTDLSRVFPRKSAAQLFVAFLLALQICHNSDGPNSPHAPAIARFGGWHDRCETAPRLDFRKEHTR